MKLINKSISIILIITMLCSVLSISVNALTFEKKDNSIAPCRVIYRPIGFGLYDQYTDAIFKTIDHAKNRFGWDFTYTPTTHYYLGVYYNWFYSFSDGTKQYFRVLFDDDNDDLTSIIPDEEVMYGS